MSRPKILLVYDKQCPACDAYCRWVRIDERAGDLQREDARENGAVVQEVTAQGLDVDQGMVLKVGERLYYGADAIHALASMSSRSGLFNKLNHWLFRSKKVCALLYPVLRSCRNLLLKCLGKTRINNLGIPGNDRF